MFMVGILKPITFNPEQLCQLKGLPFRKIIVFSPRAYIQNQAYHALVLLYKENTLRATLNRVQSAITYFIWKKFLVVAFGGCGFQLCNNRDKVPNLIGNMTLLNI